MPEGLAQTMTDVELIDLLAYLSTLKQPVSIVGQYQATGPVHEPGGRSMFEPISKLNLRGSVNDGHGQELSWRRFSADAEGVADMSPLCGGDSKSAAYAWAPIVSPVSQRARIIFDTPAEIAVWLNGKPLLLSGQKGGKKGPRAAVVDLIEGSSTLLIRVVSDGRSSTQGALVTTVVADRPVGFSLTDESAGDHGAVGR